MKENKSKGVIPEEELPVAVAEDLPVADKEALDKPDTHGPIVHMRGITKRFGNFTANHDIDFQVEKQEIHALLGENGAGKTTLMNILYGLYEPTEGDVYIRGEKMQFTGPTDAIKAGIGMVHQHFMLVENFTVLENIMLGRERTKSLNRLDKKTAEKEIQALSEKYGLKVDLHATVNDISVGMQQRVEILKALYRGADILILDEPTAVLTPQEITEITGIIKDLSEQGRTIIIITHKLREIKQLADKVTVIRRGEKIDTLDVATTTEEEMANMMVGRQLMEVVNPRDDRKEGLVLRVEDLQVRDNRNLPKVKGLDLELYRGEILGIAGIDGNGQSELIEALTGLRKVESGHVYIGEEEITHKTPHQIIDAGIGTIPEDRQRRGLVLDFTVEENMVLKDFATDTFSDKGRIKHKAVHDHAVDLSERFDVRPRNPELAARSLSGGNQQKVILAREISLGPDVLIAAQPTRGLDVGAIEYVHRFLLEQRAQGRAVLLLSFELDEVMDLSDRIAVIYDGKIVAQMPAQDANERELGLLMAGGAYEKAE